MFIEFDIARPTLVNVGQSLFFFGLAILLLAHALGNIVTWPAFYSLGSLWVIVSALLVSKWIRDRNYSQIFQSVHDDDLKEIFDKVIGVCKGSIEFQVFIWLSFAVAFLTTQITQLGWKDDDLQIAYKGTVTLFSLWCLTGTIHMAKVLRDRRDPVIGEQLKEQYPFQCMVASSFALSSCLIFVLIALPDLHDWQQFFFCVGWGYTMVATFAVVTHVRDRREALHILAAEASLLGESARAPAPISLDQSANGHIPKPVSSHVQPIMDLTAPQERRGQAARLIGQRSLVLEEGVALEYAQPPQPNKTRGIATE